jgi:hypothetical protein
MSREVYLNPGRGKLRLYASIANSMDTIGDTIYYRITIGIYNTIILLDINSRKELYQ